MAQNQKLRSGLNLLKTAENEKRRSYHIRNCTELTLY